jgi:hypothetical protein
MAYAKLMTFCPSGATRTAAVIYTYGEISKETGTVNFKESATRVRSIQGHVVTCFMLIMFMEPILDAFDEVMPFLAEIDAGRVGRDAGYRRAERTTD